MARSERQIDELRERLNGLLAEWGTEVSAVIRALEEQQSLAEAEARNSQTLENQANELTKLRQRIRERDLALDHLTKTSKERDQRFAELEKELKHARGRLEELERQLATLDKPAQPPKSVPQDEVEAMRAELAARKLLVKSLRGDADRCKALEKELAENRDAVATMKVSIARHTRTISELRVGADRWERKYRELAAAAGKQLSRNADGVGRDAIVAPSADEAGDVDGSSTVVIDMTEPLRKANDERRRKNDRR
jgi:chromosome segregation ATPase